MNKLTKKIVIGCAVLLAAAVVIFLIALRSPDTNADSYLQYAGAIIGGFATMTAVVAALLDRGQDRDIENKPKISLRLADRTVPVVNDFVYFHGEGPKTPQEKQGISLILENRGTTEVQIKGIYVGKMPLKAGDSDPGFWQEYDKLSISKPGDKWGPVSDCIDIGSSLSLPMSVSEKQYSKDCTEQTSAAKTNRFLVDIYFNNEFYHKTLFKKRYQIDQPLKKAVDKKAGAEAAAEWWRDVDIRSMGTEQISKTFEQVQEEMKSVMFKTKEQ